MKPTITEAMASYPKQQYTAYFEQLIVIQPINKHPTFRKPEKSSCNHNSLPMIPVLNQSDAVNTLTYYSCCVTFQD
jgi:hypothetical protein